MKIGKKVPVRTGEIVNIVEYKDLNLKYYCVKTYEPWTKREDLIWIEEKYLKKLYKPNKSKAYSITHIAEHFNPKKDNVFVKMYKFIKGVGKKENK